MLPPPPLPPVCCVVDEDVEETEDDELGEEALESDDLKLVCCCFVKEPRTPAVEELLEKTKNKIQTEDGGEETKDEFWKKCLNEIARSPWKGLTKQPF